ncbi:extracellular solute-binding protein [Cohnella xylanilytica]|uniref:Extracellular solute-binding protein n=1 Tax=Cohnella xylanilytica TaxID=557555 RepID=A0A841U205_9BACL|nr:extracellular solute-binding protein [Cohnella xylanilytica]MBB6692383.1 extracellular solute-binding protein [Cohnella xylanilytica]
MRKRMMGLAGVLLLSGLLASCSGGGGGEDKLKALGKDDKATIKVMFWDENYFFQEYGSLFISKYPNIDVEVANMQTLYSDGYSEDNFEKFVEEHKPDVLMLNSDQYEKWAQDGKLYALDSVIEQDKYDTETIHPAILKLLRDKGNGKLYGLSPKFSSNALFYNIDLFKKYGIEPPKDSMSWSEVLELAKRFPTGGDEKDRVYGFGTQQGSTPFNMLWTIAMTDGLRVLNPDGTQVTLSGEGWKRDMEMVVEAIKSKAVYNPSLDNPTSFTMQDYYMQDPFISGKAAMMVDYPYKVSNIKGAKSAVKDFKGLNWGLVTAPVDPNNRNQSKTFNVSSIMAVNAQSPNLRAAWEFVKYVNSEDFARVKSKSSASGDLLSRTAFNKEADGVSLEPFYKLEPAADMTTGLENSPGNFYGILSQLVDEQLKAVIDDKKSIDEAMKEIQEKAQAALVEENRKKKEEEAAKNAESPAPPASASASASASGSASPETSGESSTAE